MRLILFLLIVCISLGFASYYKTDRKIKTYNNDLILVEVGPVEMQYIRDSLIQREIKEEPTIKINLPGGPLKIINNNVYKTQVRLTPEQYEKLIQFRLKNGIHFN